MITNYKLTDLQENSIEKMSKMSSCILALSPGCGKSLCVLHYLEHILLKDSIDSKCILFIPKSARAAFKKELDTKLELQESDYIFITAGKHISYEDMSKRRYIIVENSVVNKYIEDLVSIASTNVCHLVIDEAHSLQNPKSVFASAAWEVRCYCKKIIAMTATPLLNDIEGLFNVLHFVYPRVFQSWFKFRSRYCITQDRSIRMKNRFGAVVQRNITEIIGFKNMEELNSILDKLIIKGCVHYNVNFNFLECDLDKECEKLYAMAAKGFFDILYHPEKVKKKKTKKKEDDGSASSIADDAKDFGARLHDLQRVCDGSDDSIGENFVSNKMKLMCQTVFDIVKKNESTLIYFEYIDTLELAEKILLENKDMIGFNNVYKLTGAEKEDYRAKIESSLGLKDVVLCSQAASQSRNLQRANNIIVMNCPFSCGRVVQLCGRVCRVDTTYSSQNIYFISVKDTIDTYRTTLLKKRIGLIKLLLGDESTGALDGCDCNYIDVDYSDTKELKKHFLWKK